MVHIRIIFEQTLDFFLMKFESNLIVRADFIGLFFEITRLYTLHFDQNKTVEKIL